MKNIPKLLRYLRNDKGKIVVYFIFSLLAVVFGLFSFGMLAPVLQTLFGAQDVKGNEGITDQITGLFNDIINTKGKLTALTYAVVIVVVFTVLKNLFIYLSLRILNPLRSAVMRRLRNDMFTKMLSLPIGYFTEEKKGDIVSRMTNDVNEVEVSIMSVIETLIREPITILAVLASMLYISPELTLFLLLFLPGAGFLIGRIGRSLKKPSNEAQEHMSDMMSTIDETLSGMRVVKAFNAEKHLHLRFMRINNFLFRTRNRILARRDAGSPLSETLGIIVVCIILWYGGRLIFSNQTTLTGPFFLVFIGLFYQIINPLKNLSTAFYNMQKGGAAMDRIQELMSVENSILLWLQKNIAAY
jgi:subfamily B ATP-binding cassette protein MsbA